ncbi:hypothetical protein [Weissella cibaria]|uniref:hypothetical protein n=1 Tax=Weissella cibaria TaxID=137591 RepID=UPI001FD683C8|nr:hypothetical protein [Weissella cibaria]
MENRTLSNSVAMPVLGDGMTQVQGPEVVQAITDAVAAGYRSIDTAVIYDKEAVIGQGIANLMSIDQIYF